MAAVRRLEFRKLRFLMFGTVWIAYTRHYAKFGRKQSNGCKDIAI